MNTVVSIHQPNYLPWLPYFDKIKRSDIFIIYDNAQYKKNEYMNRNKIRTPQGWSYLTIPVESKKCYLTPINKVELPKNEKWKNKHWKSIFYNYKSAKYFEDYKEPIHNLYIKEFKYLSDLNSYFIERVAKLLEFNTKILYTSKMHFKDDTNPTQTLINMVKTVNGNKYISGPFGEEYLDRELFVQQNIELEIQDYKHPVYKQKYNPFIPGLSIIDLLCNEGKKAKEII